VKKKVGLVRVKLLNNNKTMNNKKEQQLIKAIHKDIGVPCWEWHTTYVFQLLQQNKTQEAEDYFWSVCKFNPANK